MVVGEPHGNLFEHPWYVACDDRATADDIRNKIDAALKEINDDYAVERVSALRDVYLDILPEASFMEFMRLKGKIGSQHKFPRVLKGKMLADWKQFLETGKL